MCNQEQKLKKRIYDVAVKANKKPCSPHLMLTALAKDYVEYMTESCLVSNDVLISSIGFSKYQAIVADFAENLIEVERFKTHLQNEKQFKHLILMERMGARAGTNFYWKNVEGFSDERIARMNQMHMEFQKETAKV